MEFRDPAARPKDGGIADGASMRMHAKTLSMGLIDANLRPEMAGESKLPETASYFVGSDPRNWITGLPTYARVDYKAVYPGVDLSFYGKESRLEYDFLLRPGADAGKIGFALQGADTARIDRSGNLILTVGGREVKFLKPVAYQAGKDGTAQRPVDVNYLLSKGKKGCGEQLGFSVGAYDASANLVIDPVLDYGTYLPQVDSYVTGIAVDKNGNTYLATEGNASNTYYNGFTVLKFDPNGNLLLSGTMTTSSSEVAEPTAIAISSTGAVYVTGFAAPGLPTTANAYQSANTNGNQSGYFNAFLAVFQSNGSTTSPALVPSYVTYLGGSGTTSDLAYAIAVDPKGAAYIAGLTGGETFPTSTGAYQTAYPTGASSAGFIAKFDPTKSGAASLVFSTLLGGTRDYLYGIAVDGSGDAYVTGTAAAGDIPSTAGSFSYGGFNSGNGINVTKLNATGTALVYSAFLAPGVGEAIAVDGSGDAYLTGTTTAEDFPTTAGGYQTSYPGAFATELNAAGSALVYSTFLGGPSGATDYSLVTPLSISLTPGCSSACAAYVSGIVSASDFPLINAVQAYQGASTTGFVVELAGGGGSAVYSTYLGGLTANTTRAYLYNLGNVGSTPAVSVDSAGNAYVTGNLSGPLDFPVTPTPAEPAGTLENVYLAKIGPGASGDVVASPTSVDFGSAIVNVSSAIYPGRTPVTVSLLNTGSKAVTLSPVVVAPANEFAETDNCNGAIAAASSCTLKLTFTPESAGTRTGTITVTSSASATPVTIALTGTGSAQPFIEYTPSSFIFPNQVAGTTGAAQTATLTNVGHSPASNLTFNYYYGNSTLFPELNNCPSQLDPGQSCQISVQFSPSATGLSTDTIYNNSYNYYAGLHLSGTGIVAGAGGSGASVVSPATINLGSLLVGTNTSASVYFTNLSSVEPVTLNSATIALSGNVGSANDFSIGPCGTLPYQVAAAATCASTVYFTPSVAGTETATITFTDSTASSPHTVTVSGTGVGATQVLEFSPGNQVFLPQPLGYQSASQNFTVYDAGTAPVTIDRALIKGDFQIISDGCSSRTLTPPAIPGVNTGGQCSVSVAFTPTALGTRTGTLTLIDAATGNPQVLNLTGTGIAVTGSLEVQPTSLSFPVMPVGLTSTTQQVTFQNPGNTPITLNSVTATGDFAVTYTSCGAFPYILTAESSCYGNVAFTPTSSTSNPRTGTLTVASTAGNQTVSLTGTGEVAMQTIGFTPTSVGFGSIPVGTTSDVSYVYIRNTGTEDVTFSAAATVSGNFVINYDPCTGSGRTLAAGTDCYIRLQFSPTATGVQTGTLTLTDSAGTGTQTVSITGTGIATSTAVAITPDATNFSEQVVGTTSAISQLVLRNYGSSQTVTIASLSITAGGQNFTLAPGYDQCTGTAVTPGGSCYIYLQFAPTVSGYDTGTVTFVDTAGNKYAAALAGYSPAGTNSSYLSPGSLGFGSQVVGTTSPNQRVYLYNTGNLPLTVGTVTGTNYSPTGVSPAEFSDYVNNPAYDNCSGTTVQPGSNCYIFLQFTPTSAGAQTGNLVFPVTYQGAAKAVNFTASLTGVGIADSNSAYLSPSGLVFPDQVVGTTSTNQRVYLYNTGNLPLTVGTVTGTNYSPTGVSPAEFSDYVNNPAYDNCSGTTVQPGSNCYIFLQFTPTSAGAQTGNLVFPVTYQGAAKAVNFTASLTGVGIADSNSAYLSPSGLVFPDQVVGTTSTNQRVYLYNTGNLPLTVGTVTGTNYSPTGVSPAEFSDYVNNPAYDNCSGTTVQPGSNCYIFLQFTPTSAGAQTGNLVFPVTYQGAAKAVNFTASLTGVGIADSNSAYLSPSGLVFPDQVVGTTSTNQRVYLYNTGNLPLTVGTVTGTNYSPTGVSPAEFSDYVNNPAYDNCSGTTVQPGSNCYIFLQFTPTSAGAQTGNLVFPVTYQGAAKAVNFTATLTGRGIPTTATLVLSQTSVAFGSLPVGTTGPQLQVTLSNYSSSALPITSIILGGTNPSDFTESDSCGGASGTTLAANSSCQIYVTFKPALTSLGARSATITETDPGTGGSRTIALTGTGTADASAITFYPSPLAFTTSETVNQGAPGKVVTLNYQGDVPLNVTSVSSSDAIEFPVVQDECSGTTVASGGTCKIELAFAPSKSGSLSAVVSVADSASGSPQTFMVTGGGVAGLPSTTTLTATPASGAFGSLFTLVATVKGGTTPVANGSVTFYDGTKAIGSAHVVTTTSGGGVTGTATLKTLYLPLGANSITAKYTGGNVASTSAAATVTVTGKYPSGAVLSSTGTQGSYILTGTVEGGGPQTTLPSGNIVFTDNQTNTTLGTVALDATTLKQSFVNSSTLAPGSSTPQTVTMADLNGDGKLDMIVGGYNTSVFSLLLGNGDGTYGAPIVVPGNGSYAYNIVVGDLNGDGKLDVVVSTNISAAVFLGNGDGTFQGEVDYDSGVQFVGLGDFNGDGKLDLVTGTGSSSVDFLTGNGDGTFQDPIRIAAGYSNSAVLVGDFDGDGKLDVLTTGAAGNSNALTVLLGNGNGTFQAPKVSPSVNGNPYRLAVADVNGDGKLDVVSNDNDVYIGVFIGNGDGTFQTEQTITPYGGVGQPAVADVNADGKPDLIVPTGPSGNNTVEIILGNGDGTFGTAQTYPTGKYPSWASIGDINNDGKPDVAVVNQTDATVTVLLNQATITAKLTGVTLPGVSADKVTGAYSGDTNYAAATTNTLSLASNAGVGSTTLTVTPTTGALGTIFTLSASVLNAAAAQVTTGSVNFFVNGSLLANVEIDSTTGIATYETGSLPIGTVSLTAVFPGTASNRGSSSKAISVKVTGKYATTTALTATGVQGNYALTAVVDGFGLGSPSGSVVFTDSSTSPATSLGTVTLASASLKSTFLKPLTPTISAGGQARWVVSGDFNGDGKQDFAVANYGSTGVNIFLGKGDGSFATPLTATVLTNPVGLAVGDFNGDGKLDLAVGYYNGSNSVSILLGNGDGTFQTAPSYTAGTNPESVAVGDFNGDGKLDLAVGNYAGTMVSVLLGKGDGTFAAANTFGSNFNGVYGLTVGDFNHDGKLDIATANGSSVGIFIGKGDGTFGAEADYSSNSGTTFSVVTGDINLDGKLDLVTANSNGNVSVLLGTGDGTFQAAQTYATASSAYSLTIADVNGDGNPDLVTANYGNNTISVLLGNGTAGTFQTQQPYTVGANPYAVAIADFNGDGRPDIATANFGDSTASILIGSVTEDVELTGITLPGSGADNITATYIGDTAFTASTSNTLALPSNPLSTTTTLSATPTTGTLGSVVTLKATVADSKGHAVTNGNVDFYNGTMLLETQQLISVANGTSIAGTATYTTRALPTGTDSLTAKFTGTEFDGPSASTAQTVTVSGRYPTTTTLTSTGTKGNYTLTAGVQTYSLLTPTGNVTFTDTNTNETLGTAALNGATAGLNFAAAASPATGTNPYVVVLADVNNDQKLDMVVANYLGTMVSVLLGNGDGTYQAANSFGTNFSGVYFLAVGDFNNDGKLDIATANGSSVGIFLGNGDGTFGAETDYAAGNTTRSVAVGDFNHDGKLDLVTANSSGTLSVLLGNGDGTFQTQQTYAAGSGYPAVAVGDFNGDGKPDLAVAEYSEGVVGILLGNGDGTFQSQQRFSVSASGPISIALADINGDGKLDVVVGDNNSAALTVLLGNGDGTLGAGTLISSGGEPDSVEIGDVNGDGKLDLVVGNYQSSTIGIYLGNGDGTFKSPTTLTSATPSFSALGDVNNDGRLDIAAVNYASANTAQIFLNQLGLTATLTGVNVAGSGTHNVTATYAGDTNFTGSTSPSIQLAATLASSAITLTAQPSASVAYGQPLSVAVTVTGQTGTDTPTGNISYTVDGGTSQTAALVSGTVTLNLAGLAVGSHALVANYAGDQIHGAATQQTLALTITKAAQTITFNNPGNPTYGSGAFGLYAVSTSGLPVTVKVISGPAVVSGNVVTATGAGTVVLEADQAGNASYNAAPAVQQTFTELPAALSVVVNSTTKVYGSTNPAFTSTVKGLIGTDTVAVNYTTTATTTSPLGTYPINASISGPFAANYTPTVTAGTLTITKTVLTLTVNNSTRVYGATNPTFTGTITGLQGTDTATATYTTTATVASPVVAGGYPITATVTGSNLGNYTLNILPGTLTLTPSPLTIAVTNASRSYGATNPSFSSTFTGVLNGDIIPVAYSTSAVATSNVGTYPVTASTTDSNYTATVVPGTLTINPTTLTILVNSFTKVYGTANPTLTGSVSGLLFSDTVSTTYATIAVQGTSVGTYRITATISGGASANYTASVTPGTLTITQAVLTATAANQSRQYDLPNPALTYAVTGFVNGDSASVVSGAATLTTTATLSSPIGTYPITFVTEGLTATNYSFIYAPGTLGVSGGTPQTITFGALPGLTYGAAPFTLTATASSGLPVNYTVTGPATVSGSTLSITGAGQVTVTASQAGNVDFAPATSVPQSFSVAKAILTATAANQSRQYDLPNPALTYTVTGLVNGDNASVVSGTATLTTTASLLSAIGTYPITFAVEGLTAANYSFIYAPGTLTVSGGTPQSISFGPLSGTTYGASPFALTAKASSGLPVSYAVTGPATVSGSTLTITGAGSVTVTASQAGNVDFTAATPVSQSFTVAKAVLTVTAVNEARAYDVANPALTYTTSGFVNGDTRAVVSGTATLTTTATLTSPVGTYPITFATEALAAANYSFAYLAGTLTVGNGSQSITFAALPNLTYGAAPFGLTATASSGLPVSYLVTGPATVSGSTLTITGAGSVTVTASQAGNADFTAATPVSETFTVAKAVLTATAANQARAYDFANPTLTYTVSGFVNGDTSAVVSGTATLTTTAGLTSAPGGYPITFATEGLSAANYAFTYASGTLTVGNGSQSITFGPLGNLIYGASPFALTATATSSLPVSYSVTGPATVSGSTLTITGAGTVTVTAAQAGNADYTAATPISQNFTVAKAVLTATAVNQARSYDVANPTLTYTTSGFVNGDTSAVVSGTATLTTTATLTSPVGTYPITFATEALKAANYSFSYGAGTLTVGSGSQSITFAALPNLIYGASPFALTATASSGLPVSYAVTGPATVSGSTLSIIGAGSVTVTASQAGNMTFNAATSVSESFTVAKAVLTATAVNQARAYDVANPTLTYSVTGFLNGDTSSVVSGTATLTTTATLTSPVGAYPITFATEGLAATNYSFTYVTGTLTVGNGSQSLTFAALPNVTYGAAPFVLTATSSSGLPVSYTVTGPATVSGLTLSITGAGSVTVTASQAGNVDFTAATPVSQTFTVAKAVLTAAAVNQARAYDVANPALIYAASGFVNGDTGSVVSGTATLTTTATLTSPVGTYPITFATEGLTAANYSFAYVAGTLTVGNGSQSITFAALPNLTYGAASFTLTATASSGLPVSYAVTGPATVSGSTLSITGAGSVTVTASQAGNANFSLATPVSESFTVAKAVLVVTAVNQARAYNVANPTLAYTTSGFVNGDASGAVSGTATLTTTATLTSPVGTYPITFATEGLSAANYSFSYVAGTLTVGNGSQSITFAAIPNLTYGAAPFALTATASSGLPVSYTVTGPASVSGSTLSITGAGSITVTASQSGNADYTAATPVSESLTVAKAALNVTAVNQARAYNVANPALTYTVSGFLNGDTSTVVSGTATLTTTATLISPVGTYPITFATEALTATNYTFRYAAGTLTVGNGSQSITFAALPNLNYGTSPFALTATASSGLPVSYTVTGPATVSGTTLSITGAGSVTVTASQAGNANFMAAVSVSQGFTVAKAALTAAAVNQARAYDVANPTLTYTTSGFVNGDTSAVVSGTATLTTTATLTSPLGIYPITFATEALAATNYSFTYAPGTLTVGNGSQTITFAALPNLTYGAAPFTLTATASSGLTVSYLVTGPATVSGSTLTITGAGLVTVTASQAGNADFTAAPPVSETFTVAKAALTATAVNQARAYGVANPALTYTTSGFVNGDTSGVVSGTASLTTTATLSSPVGTYPITFVTEALTAANYTFTYAAGTLTVGNSSQSITFAALPNLIYGASPFALTATSSSGLPVSYTVTGPATASGSTVTITGAGSVKVTANQPGNGSYTAATPVSQSFTVTKASLTASANNASKAAGAANPTFTYTVAGFVNGDTSAAVGGIATLTTTAANASPAGTYPITFATTALVATNYTFTYIPGTLTVTPAGNQCNVINYGSGFTPAGVTLNKGATITGGLLQLTDGKMGEARSAFVTTKVPISTFVTDFTFQLLNPNADGFAFVVQGNSPNAVGQGGMGLGYAGITDSAAIKFDLHNNSGEGADSTGIYYGGAEPTTPAVNLAASGIDLHSGHIFAVHLFYTGKIGSLKITDTMTKATTTFSGNVDMNLIGPNAYVGFTAGTGSNTATQNILSWTYSSGPGCPVN